MTQKITPPEGFEIDKEKSTFEEIVFKPICKYPTQLEKISRPFFISDYGKVVHGELSEQTENNFTSKERAEEVLALIQLLAFRDAVWAIDNWRPDWTDDTEKYAIAVENAESITVTRWSINAILSFKTTETRDWFYHTHRELIKKAKGLL